MGASNREEAAGHRIHDEDEYRRREGGEASPVFGDELRIPTLHEASVTRTSGLVHARCWDQSTGTARTDAELMRAGDPTWVWSGQPSVLAVGLSG